MTATGQDTAAPAAPAAQQPDWPDRAALRAVTADLAGRPPLTLPEECDRLRAKLAAVARGEAFLLQGGDCAETFGGVTARDVGGKVRTLLQMAVVLSYAASVPVVKVGRMAGQYAKPRSRPTETRDGVTLPAYRGDAVNGPGFSARERTADPQRLVRVYDASAATLNIVRSLTTGGFADLRRVHEWNRDFVAGSPAGGRYERLIRDVQAAMRFMETCGAPLATPAMAEFFTSHEALLLDYESALTRPAGPAGEPYDLSAHMVWIGERTRALDGAHVAFASRIRNPIGVKIGPATTGDDVLALVDRLDPDREPGRLTFITRMGAAVVRDRLPELVEKVTAGGAAVGWVCDPMHGNTVGAPCGRKTRHFDTVLDEVAGFFEVHKALGTRPGGIHLELTGDDVTECVGGARGVRESELHLRYTTACDPRLGHSQALELAFAVAGFLLDS
jgi:3-deoxy-7-phosphoheptulonate synthase